MMRGRGGFGANESPEIMVERMLLMGDWDGDDRISRDEAPEQILRQFEQMDANGDGFADKDELMQMIQRQPQQESRQGILSRLLEQDTNGDGKSSVEEAPDAVRQRFERMDANGDGFLDQREIQAMMSGRGRQQR